MLLRRLAPFLLTTLALSLNALDAEAGSFTGLGGLGAPLTTFAFDVSADGTTVVGRSVSPAPAQAFRWTQATGMVGLGDLPGGLVSSVANGVSGDGGVVVGEGNNAFFSSEAFRWDSTNGMTGLGVLSGATTSRANGISSDGAKIVGQTGGGRNEAFLWDAANGMQGLGDLAGGSDSSIAFDISADGSTVVGRGTSASGSEAFVWNAGGGMQGLGDLAGGAFNSFASGASADGSVVIGRGTSASGSEAFIWDATNGMRGLGDLAGGRFLSQADDVTADGGIVVGYGNGASGQRAMIWDAANGMQELSVFLTAMGIDVTGWVLSEASAISDDGRVIVGTGTNPNGLSEAWIAVIPEPGTALLLGLGLAALATGRRRA